MRFRIGALDIVEVEEMCGPSIGVRDFLPDLPPDPQMRNPDWLTSGAVDPASNMLVMSMRSWLVRTPRHTILIDTCCGNDKVREYPSMNQLTLPWLDRLAAAGTSPEQVDYVMCTHLHVDHVGWNTRLLDGRWVPTFPNARYIFARQEYDHWRPGGANEHAPGHRGVFNDSVLPCVEAGQVDLVDDGYALGDHLLVEAAPGHTLGHCALRAKSNGQTGIFTGDVMHSPIQIYYPDVNTVSCEDPVQARHTRRRMLADAAEHGHVILPAHFPNRNAAGRVRQSGDFFTYHPLD